MELRSGLNQFYLDHPLWCARKKRSELELMLWSKFELAEFCWGMCAHNKCNIRHEQNVKTGGIFNRSRMDRAKMNPKVPRDGKTGHQAAINLRQAKEQCKK